MSAALIFECDGCGKREYAPIRPYGDVRHPDRWKGDGGRMDFCPACKAPADQTLAERLKAEGITKPEPLPPAPKSLWPFR